MTAGPARSLESAHQVERGSETELSNKSGDDKSVDEAGQKASQAGELAMDELARAASLTDPNKREQGLESVLSKASLQDVKKALDWALSLPEGAVQRSALGKIMERWGQLDGPGATDYAMKNYEETGSSALLKEALRGWGQTDAKASIDYAQSLGISDGVRRDITRDVLRDWADRNPQAAAAYASASNLSVGRGGVTSIVSDRWSKQDPQAAAGWALGLPAGQDQQRALSQLIRNWSDINIKGAADFVNSQPMGTNREVMISTLAREIGRQDISAGLQWASTLTDPAMQDRTVGGVLWRTARENATLAQQLLQDSSLSAEMKQSWMVKLTNSSGWGRGGP